MPNKYMRKASVAKVDKGENKITCAIDNQQDALFLLNLFQESNFYTLRADSLFIIRRQVLYVMHIQ